MTAGAGSLLDRLLEERHRGFVIGLVALVAAVAIVVVVTSGSGSGPESSVFVPQGATREQPGTHRSWRSVQGGWTLSAARLAVASRDQRGNAMLITDGMPGGTAFSARIATVKPGAGVVFRYGDPSNFWSLTAAPYYGTWVLAKVVSGLYRKVGNTGLSVVSDGTLVSLTLQTRGTIVVSINNVVRLRVQDADIADRIGLGVLDQGLGARRASYGDVMVGAVPTSTVVPAAPTAPPGARAGV